MAERLVIIGGVAAGMKTAAKARRENPELEINVYQEENVISYAGCGLTYYISDTVKDRKKLIHRTPEIMREKSNINVHINHRVTKIVTEDREIEVIDLENKETFRVKYDKLVIATGARPKKLLVQGVDAKNIFYLNSINDADKIKEAIKTSKKAVVTGGGFFRL